jgi:RNA polymerase sigma factor (sigma-70 family)
MTDFATTQWSMIFAARSDNSKAVGVALSRLCERYRPAVLAYTKRLVANVQEAEDLTQGFFIKLLEQRIDTLADPNRGRFRNFLKVSIANHFRTQLDAQRAQKRTAHDDVPEGNAELTPEQMFDHAFAKVVIKRALQTLKTEAQQADKAELFDAIRPFLIDQAARNDYQNVADAHGMRANTFAVHVHRLKSRLRELIRSELLDTVANSDQLQQELRELRQPVSA